MKTPARTILIVEDEPHIAEVVALKLEQAQFATVICRDAAEALRVLEGGGIDLVIADVGMPGMSGIELARRVSARHAVPVILLTGISPADQVFDRASGYVADVIGKPFSPRQLLARTMKVLDGPKGASPVKPVAATSA